MVMSIFRRPAAAGVGVVTMALAVVVIATDPAVATAAHTERVSVSTDEVQGNALSQTFTTFVTSDTGRFVALVSAATNLVAADTNAVDDVFVRDRLSGTTQRVSVATGGAEGNAMSGAPAISGDGRYIVFVSNATNLVAGDTNGATDVFLRDRRLGTTERVSVTNSEGEADGRSVNPTVSDDGRYVAFPSNGTNLVAGDTNGVQDGFVRDRLLGTTERISVSTAGAEGNGTTAVTVISDDGRHVSFHSLSTTLVVGDLNGAGDIFLRDRLAGTTERVSLATNGAEGNGAAGIFSSVSADGRYVAFDSVATNLVIGDGNAVSDIFVRDRQHGITQRVSVTTFGAEGDGPSVNPSMSDNGRCLSFVTAATNLVPGDTNAATDVMLHDRWAGTTQRVSVATGGGEGNGLSAGSAISGDSQHIAFRSVASNLVAGDTNGVQDVFVHQRA